MNSDGYSCQEFLLRQRHANHHHHQHHRGVFAAVRSGAHPIHFAHLLIRWVRVVGCRDTSGVGAREGSGDTRSHQYLQDFLNSLRFPFVKNSYDFLGPHIGIRLHFLTHDQSDRLSLDLWQNTGVILRSRAESILQSVVLVPPIVVGQRRGVAVLND